MLTVGDIKLTASRAERKFVWTRLIMKNATDSWVRITSRVLLLVLSISGTPDLALAFSPQESTSSHEQQGAQTPASEGSPSSRGKSKTSADGPLGPAKADNLPDSPSVLVSPAADASQQSASGQSSSQPFNGSEQRPVGTAAAEAANIRGTGASKPAGMAIAPGKQHQRRSFLIKVGAIVGAGAAIGTVMALSMASPSKPPGAK
jgi:hypothetical protein